jgi:thymidylate synthase
MRSSDVPVGLPFNIAQYALLTNLLAQEAGMELGTLTVFIADAHIYTNQLDLAKEQILRNPHATPEVVINPHDSIYDLTVDHFELRQYEHDDKIPYPVSV